MFAKYAVGAGKSLNKNYRYQANNKDLIAGLHETLCKTGLRRLFCFYLFLVALVLVLGRAVHRDCETGTVAQ